MINNSIFYCIWKERLDLHMFWLLLFVWKAKCEFKGCEGSLYRHWSATAGCRVLSSGWVSAPPNLNELILFMGVRQEIVQHIRKRHIFSHVIMPHFDAIGPPRPLWFNQSDYEGIVLENSDENCIRGGVLKYWNTTQKSGNPNSWLIKLPEKDESCSKANKLGLTNQSTSSHWYKNLVKIHFIYRFATLITT